MSDRKSSEAAELALKQYIIECGENPLERQRAKAIKALEPNSSSDISLYDIYAAVQESEETYAKLYTKKRSDVDLSLAFEVYAPAIDLLLIKTTPRRAYMVEDACNSASVSVEEKARVWDDQKSIAALMDKFFSRVETFLHDFYPASGGHAHTCKPLSRVYNSANAADNGTKVHELFFQDLNEHDGIQANSLVGTFSLLEFVLRQSTKTTNPKLRGDVKQALKMGQKACMQGKFPEIGVGRYSEFYQKGLSMMRRLGPDKTTGIVAETRDAIVGKKV